MALTSSYQPIHFTPYQSTTLLKHDFRKQTKRASVVYNEASSFVSSPLFQASRRHLLPCSLDIYAPLPRRCLNMAKSQIFKAALLLLELSLYCVLCVYTVLIVLSYVPWLQKIFTHHCVYYTIDIDIFVNEIFHINE